jgi:large subunit ribosomal protein L7/L12
MPQDATGWIVVLVALALGFALGRRSASAAAPRDRLMGAPPPLTQVGTKPSPEALAAVRAALAAGNRIEAIKLLREATGMGLKASKEAVERMAGGG